MAIDSKSKRLTLQETLEEILIKMGEKPNVYFQPPESIKMHYPAIRYNLNDMHDKKADDNTYYRKKNYTITIIDRDPDSSIPEEVLKLPYCSFGNFYIGDNLNHWVLTLYF